MSFDTKGSFACGEGSYDFAVFSVPKLYLLIKTRTNKFLTAVHVANVSDCFAVAHVGS